VAVILGLDIGSNSVGSAWIDTATGSITTGLSVFPAGVDEADDKRGDPKNVKRRLMRRARITLARRSARKRLLRAKLISVGLLPENESDFKRCLDETDPWELRRKGLTAPLAPHEFGRVLLHLAQRRGALGFESEVGDTGKVKKAVTDLQLAMLEAYGSEAARQSQSDLRESIETLAQKKNRTESENDTLEASRHDLKRLVNSLLENPIVTFGRFIADQRDKRRTAITTDDRRKTPRGPREWRQPVRNKAGRFEFHADRAMIRDEFAKLWQAQKGFVGSLSAILTDELRILLDDESGDAVWRHKGLLFGQRRVSWDLGTLGRCVLEPSERCVPHADMHASRFRVVETVNNLRIIERGKEARPLTKDERAQIKAYLSGPLGVFETGRQRGQPKRSVTVTDLRKLLGWGAATKGTPFRLNIESDEEREINTDWFSREIVHGAITTEKWEKMAESVQSGINRALLNHDPDDEKHEAKLRALVMRDWAALNETEAEAFIRAWKKRPRPDAKRLTMSRRAVRNLLSIMDRDEPWPDPERSGRMRWLTQIEARKQVAADPEFQCVTTKQSLDDQARRRYATGSKGATARDRHYIRKHLLKRNGEPIFGPDGLPLHEPPPAPLISNPVVRKAIHEVRRQLIEYLKKFGCKPDQIYVELAREAKMGKKDADIVLERNRLRNRIKKDIVSEFDLGGMTSTQRETAVRRVLLAAQQGSVCPLCGKRMGGGDSDDGMTLRAAAFGEGVELAHVIPARSGGHNGLENLVLAHTKCNREMARRTPREYWNDTLPGGFDEGIGWVEKIYGAISRPKPSEMGSASGPSLWLCYFAGRPRRFGPTFDDLKVEQFKKNVTDLQGMTERQLTATRYAARQVMAYLADALYDGGGLPERGGQRRIFASDGLWTSRLRREWGLFFDPHGRKSNSLSAEERTARGEKDRGDHRHHAVDAVAIALSSDKVRDAWKEREKQADREGLNTADDEVMEAYRRTHRLEAPAPFANADEFRDAVRDSVFGVGIPGRPVCHRPVKRKLIGALHEEMLFGPVLDIEGNLSESFTARKSIQSLEPNHLRTPSPESRSEAVKRLSKEFQRQGLKSRQAREQAEKVVGGANYKPRMVDPPPGKSGIVRDRALRMRIRECLSGFQYTRKNRSGEPIGEPQSVDPDNFSAAELKQAIDEGRIRQKSGVPIRSVILLRTMNDPVIIKRKRPDYGNGRMLVDDDPGSMRAYVGGNNHHIEIRVIAKKNGEQAWSGEIISAYECAQRKGRRLKAIRAAGVPDVKSLRRLPKSERAKWKSVLREIERKHPIVDRSDDPERGEFVASVAEGEMLVMKHKETGIVGYFVVAKLDKPQAIVLVPHWDARAATGRKDSGGNKVAESKREQFAITPGDLVKLAPPGYARAMKVRVAALGESHFLEND
jgi:CRISPR-associated endonuclease Csn1